MYMVYGIYQVAARNNLDRSSFDVSLSSLMYFYISKTLISVVFILTILTNWMWLILAHLQLLEYGSIDNAIDNI